MKTEDPRINDIIAMLDRSVSKGMGHINIEVREEQNLIDRKTLGELSMVMNKTVETLGCLDCSKGNLACSVPTLHAGIDYREEQEDSK